MFEEESNEQAETRFHPMVPLRDVVIFPGMILPFVAGREFSVNAIEASLMEDDRVVLATQKDPEKENPTDKDIYRVGTLCEIIQNVKRPDGNMKVLVEGKERVRRTSLTHDHNYFQAEVEVLEEPSLPLSSREKKKELFDLFKRYARLNRELPFENIVSSLRNQDLLEMMDTISSHLMIKTEMQQKLLEAGDPKKRLEMLFRTLRNEIEKLKVEHKIDSEVREQMSEAQKEYFLSEKMKAIKRELAERGGGYKESEELRAKIKEAGMPPEIEEKALKELSRFEDMPPISAESTVIRNYLEWLLEVPWNDRSDEIGDLKHAEKILQEDHYGLLEPKERILEYLAVRQLVEKSTTNILCFVGPPGTGKTSLAQSIARATGRKFVRLSLGGIRDEAEIRGHRRTYIGAFPGQIIQMISKAGTKNPVFLLDEVDKMGRDFRGDPASALVEVLDPEHNCTFLDRFLDVEFDLSEVMFICTANIIHPIPPALCDRMELIRLPGYTINEKLVIASQYLVPKQLREHGLADRKIAFQREALAQITEKYTQEAGVRNLERNIAKICRKIAKQAVTNGEKYDRRVTPKRVPKYLGPPKFDKEVPHTRDEVGLAIGLAWTESGGEILTTEVTLMKGEGELKLTGKMGEVMQESAQAALSYARSRAKHLLIDENFHEKLDMHVHVPKGAIPKDGPSAGITIATAMISSLTNRPVSHEVAMTGEITLRGKVLAIGGVKEKVIAAHRAGVTHVILPAKNEQDLEDIPEDIQKEVTFRFVETMDEVIDLVLREDDQVPAA